MITGIQIWTNRCRRYRHVSERAVIDKLRECQNAGVDVDRIPLSLTLADILRLSVNELREKTV